MIVATNRPTRLEHVTAQFNHQSYQPRELVMVLHGDRFPSDTEEGLEQLVEGPLTVVRVSSTATLGDALNAGTDAASGELITKMDDDDWYGPEHLWDLVSAAEYSGAELVAGAGVRLPRAARPHDSALRGQGRELEPYRRGGNPDDLGQPRGPRRMAAAGPWGRHRVGRGR